MENIEEESRSRRGRSRRRRRKVSSTLAPSIIVKVTR